MAIPDQAMIFAERFKNNPAPLKQALLNPQSGPNAIDPFTALRALQIQDQASRTQMAQTAQQPTQAPSQKDQALAALSNRSVAPGVDADPSNYFGTGGIVAFAAPNEDNNHSLVTSNDGGDGGDGENSVTTQLSNLVNTSPGDPVAYRAFTGQLNQAIGRVANAKYTAPTTADTLDTAKQYFEQNQKLLGPSPIGDMRAQIQKYKGDADAGLEQDKGVAFLKAAQAMAQGNNFIRAAGNAAGEFGDSYGKALKANQEEHRSLLSMDMNLAHADYADRKGDLQNARAFATQANKDAFDKAKFEMDKDKALGELASRGAQVTKPQRPIGAGAGSKTKLPEQAAADIYNDLKTNTKPNEGETPQQFDARIRRMASTQALQMAHTTDVGATKAGLGYAGLDAATQTKVNTEVDNKKYADSRWTNAAPADRPAIERTIREEIAADYSTPIIRNPSAGTGAPAAPAAPQANKNQTADLSKPITLPAKPTSANMVNGQTYQTVHGLGVWDSSKQKMIFQ